MGSKLTISANVENFIKRAKCSAGLLLVSTFLKQIKFSKGKKETVFGLRQKLRVQNLSQSVELLGRA
jgi:hypothetical protein